MRWIYRLSMKLKLLLALFPLLFALIGLASNGILSRLEQASKCAPL